MNTYTKSERMNPIQEEMAKNVGTYNITAIIEEDKETLATLKNVPGLIAFLCTLKIGNEVISVGRGSATINQMNKFVSRGVRYSFGNSLVDAVVRGIKNMDALYFKTIHQPETKIKEEFDLERRDEPAFYGDEDMPQFATDKQKKFLVQLLEKCNDSTKKDYLEQIHSPYFSRFDASELISSLLPMK